MVGNIAIVKCESAHGCRKEGVLFYVSQKDFLVLPSHGRFIVALYHEKSLLHYGQAFIGVGFRDKCSLFLWQMLIFSPFHENGFSFYDGTSLYFTLSGKGLGALEPAVYLLHVDEINLLIIASRMYYLSIC